jgi:hypothetical protein
MGEGRQTSWKNEGGPRNPCRLCNVHLVGSHYCRPGLSWKRLLTDWFTWGVRRELLHHSTCCEHCSSVAAELRHVCVSYGNVFRCSAALAILDPLFKIDRLCQSDLRGSF